MLKISTKNMSLIFLPIKSQSLFFMNPVAPAVVFLDIYLTKQI